MYYYPSSYNHLIQVEPTAGQATGIVCNLFCGASAFVNEAVYQALLDGDRDGRIAEGRLSSEVWEYLIERGFVWAHPDGEERFIGDSAYTLADRDQIAATLKGGNYGFITSLHCNLACPYCFQRAKADSCGFLTTEQVDLGLAAIARCEERVTALNEGELTLPRVAITGGEPLLRNKTNLAVLDYLLDRLHELDWPYSITTNGTELAEFVAERELAANCRNIQVTLDGPRTIHDQRRCFRDGSPSFDRICAGVDAALASGWSMTLRAHCDMANVDHLPGLAEFVRAQGWTDAENFYAYASPITDHGSIGGYDTPKDEADLLAAILSVVDRAPIVRQVFDIRHFRGFNYVERILLDKDPKYPVMYRCEAVTGMYTFDPRGDIHVCLEAVGDPTLRIGTYDPQWTLDDAAVARWAQRNVLDIPECTTCKIRFICAGGCTVESFNNKDRTACMPFLREMDIAWHYYARVKPELFA